ncbi:MAG: hypothetical protein AAFZ52_00555 [Bacteroidota bacterium]
MTYARFYRLLGLFSLLAVGGVTIIHTLLALDYAIPLSAGIIILLAALCVGIFYLGKRTVGAENKYLFGNVFIGITVFKLFLCGGVMAAYTLLGEPQNKLFVIPFFFTYLVYTALEMTFLVKLAAEGK